MLAGESIGAGAISEPDFGSNSSNIQTTAIADGDEWVINGTKQWISNGPICDHVNVTVTSAPKQPNEGRSRLANIFVDRERSPFATTRVNDILGLRAWANGELHFDDCRVPRDHMRDRPAPESGRSQRNWAFEYPRSMLAIMSTGIAQASIDASIKYAQERQQWGRPIGSFQLVQELIVDSIIETEAARFLAYRAMDLLDKGEDCSWQASVAKAYATEMGIRATSRAIEVHGGVGLLGDLPLERYFRDARTMTIPDGTTEIQKLVIGRQLIGLAAFV
jgi:alkylation response protein AidB-like acyl-CoA dehydrogenase